MKILVTGCEGFLGTHLTKYLLKNDYDVIGASLRKKSQFLKNNYFSLDFTDLNKTQKFIKNISPTIIINTIALTSVDECEKKPILAKNLNVNTINNIVESIQNMNIRLIHISTDQLFDGKKSFYTETSTTNPINVYGKTKLKAEKVIINNLKDYIIIRTNFFGWSYNKNIITFAEWVYNSLVANKKITMFNDVYFTPLEIMNLIESIEYFIKDDVNGIYNCSNSNRISKYEFGLKIAKKLNINQKFIQSISIDDFSFNAKRPKDMSLSNNKVLNLCNMRFLNINSSIDKFIKIKI